MHKASLDEMAKHIKTYIPKPCSVLDVGSMNVRGKGCYKQLLSDDYLYMGIDLEAGDNVDIVLDDPYKYPFPDNSFDAVLCGQVLEHCEYPYKLVQECQRVLRPGGVFIGVAPFIFPEHHKPDLWRILPDGWKTLFFDADLGLIDAYLHKYGRKGRVDCWGLARG
jgi:SAM-dependent methyltransferase